MARTHIEFIQSQNVAWEPAARWNLRRRARVKVFSHDPVDGALTALIEYEAGSDAIQPFSRSGSEEFYVLDGELVVDGQTLRRHHYAFVPPNCVRTRISSPTGALVLTFCNGGKADDEASDASAGTPMTVCDTQAMPWDGSTLDPKLAHLRLSRKILRDPTDGSCRTYLLAGLPHGRPVDGRLQVERHPHAEEMFLIEGDMACPQGVMRAGAYFYRPAGIDHGPHFSEHGFFMFMRNPGTNVIRTEWLGEAQTLPADPGFQPVLPADAPTSWSRALPTRPAY